MKHIAIIFLLCGYTWQLFGIGEGAEISFSQDSLLPTKIYLRVQLLSPVYYNGNERDSIFINWGDGSQSFIYLADTFPVAQLDYPLYDAIYRGSHLYDTAASNGIITIHYIDAFRSPVIINIANSDLQVLEVQAMLNFQLLKHMHGYRSPEFHATLYLADSILSPVSYDPLFTSFDTNRYEIKLVTPVNCPYTLPDQYAPPDSHVVLSCDSLTGLFYWHYPYFTGQYDIVFGVAQFYQNTLISSIRRDMLIYVKGRQPTSINEIKPANMLLVYPSPTSGPITIDMSSFTPADRQLTIYDALGQMVYTTITLDEKFFFSYPLTPGVYTATVTQGEQRGYARFVRE